MGWAWLCDGCFSLTSLEKGSSRSPLVFCDWQSCRLDTVCVTHFVILYGKIVISTHTNCTKNTSSRKTHSNREKRLRNSRFHLRIKLWILYDLIKFYGCGCWWVCLLGLFKAKFAPSVDDFRDILIGGCGGSFHCAHALVIPMSALVLRVFMDFHHMKVHDGG